MKSGVTCWQSPANIALVKYWGKREPQLPTNPSLSITLSQSVSQTTVKFWENINRDPLLVFRYDERPEPSFEPRVARYLESILPHLPFLKHFSLEVDSFNTFPHSSGISSSAAFMSSLALSLCQIERWIEGNYLLDDAFRQKASLCARLGSGSAARSVYGNFVIWGHADFIAESSDEYAIPWPEPVHPVFDNYHDAILIMSSARKSLSSSAGHALMNNHPYASQRYLNAHQNLKRLTGILKSGDLEGFVTLVEQEALELHGLIMSSPGGPVLMEPQTLTAIRTIRQFRKETGCQIAFSLDAGPNLHLLYPQANREQVVKFISDQLAGLCEKSQWIDDQAGAGPVWMETLSEKE